MDTLTIKFVGQGNVGDAIPDFSVGYVDGIGRAVVMHAAVILLHEEVGSEPCTPRIKGQLTL